MNRKKRRCSLVVTGLLVFSFFIGLWQTYEFFDKGFNLKNISYDLERKESLLHLDPVELQKLKSILNQPYYYLDHGTQSYVFVSHDQKYVLKFFKFRHLKPSKMREWLEFIPFVSDYQKIQEESKRRKFERLFSGYQIAYEKDKENNALIYLHLSPTHFLQQLLVVIDRFGFKHQIYLDDVVFVIQKKGEATRSVMANLLKKGDMETAKVCFQKIMDLYVSEYKKGICDSDHNVMYNTGFVDEKAVRLDVGRLIADENYRNPAYFKSDLEKVGLKRIDRWLRVHFPQYREEINQEIKHKLDEIFSDYFAGPPLTSSPSQ